MLNLKDVRAIKILDEKHCKLVLCSKYAITDAYFPIDFMKRLDRRFVRCNKYYIVNLDHFAYIDGKNKTAVMDDDMEVPLSWFGTYKLKLSFFLYEKMKNKG